MRLVVFVIFVTPDCLIQIINKTKMNKLTINIPEGFQIDSFDTETGTVSFKPIAKGITERIKTFDDVLEYHGTEGAKFTGTPDEVAYKKLKLIVSALNEGWVPNWHDSYEAKYYPWFKWESGGFLQDDYVVGWTCSLVGSRLCFKSGELAEYAANTFMEIYKDFFCVTQKDFPY